MLSKCANPGCSASFLYLHQGKLFRLETSGNGDDTRIGVPDPQGKNSSRRLEYFWLCDDCASVMTVSFKKGVGVTTRPLFMAQKQLRSSKAQGGVGAYLPVSAFQRIFNISTTMRVPSRNGLMRVPVLCAQATGTSATLNPYFFAR
jgi:hypothetical protein